MCLEGYRKGVIFFFNIYIIFLILRFCPIVVPFLSLFLGLFVFP